ncbi:MAG: hypothetical protein ACFCU5_03630 [Pleurocapsa sp.]
MFNLSDRPQHKIVGDVGIVVGYGNRRGDNKYLSTIRVQLTNFASIGKIKEDFYRKWSLSCQV